MEDQKNNKKMYDIKPFKILNAELQDRGIVDNTFSLLSEANSKGKRSRLRIKRHKINKDEISIANLGKWDQRYIRLFKSMVDPWNNELEDLEGNLSGTSQIIHQMYCKRDYEIRKRTSKGCRKYKQKKSSQNKTKKKTKQSRTKQRRTKKNFSKKSQNQLQKITSRIRPDLEEDSSDEEDAHILGYVEPTAENIYELQDKTSGTSDPDQRKSISPNADISVKESQQVTSPTFKQEQEKLPSLSPGELADSSQSPEETEISLTNKSVSKSMEQPMEQPMDQSIEHSLSQSPEEEQQQLAEIMRQDSVSPEKISRSRSISISKQELPQKFSQQCQELIDLIKDNFKSLSIQSKEYQKLLQCTHEKNKEQLEEYRKIDNLLYPHLDDPNIALKIANKKEFRDVEIPKKSREQIENIEEEANKICSPNMQFELEPHQKFIRNFLSFQSPYNSLLIFHGLGTGKTCSSISVCEEMRNYYQQIGSKKKIMIIASPKVQENYRLQLFDKTKLKEINGLWNLKACTGNKFIKEVNPMSTKGLSKERVVKQINKIIRQSYEFLGYTEFANKIQKIIKKYQGDDKKNKSKQRRAIDREFSGRLLVIDEVHNIRANDEKRRTTRNLLDLVSFSRNMKLLLLTATPMFNEATEIVWLANLMNLNDNRFPIKIKDIFDDKNNFIETENHSGKELLIQKLNGYVSYVSGENPFSFPFRIFPYTFNSPNSLKTLLSQEWRYPTEQVNGLEISPEDQIKYLDVYVNSLEDYQEKAYNYLIEKMKEKHPQLNEKRKGIQYTMIDGPLQLLNFAYPHLELQEEDYLEKDIQKELYGRYGMRRLMDYTKSSKREFRYKESTIQNFGRIFSSDGEDPPLRKYSSKIYEFINLVKNSEGICLIYSNYIDGGCIPIALALEEMGIYRYNKSRSLFKEHPSPAFKVNGQDAKYIMITGDKKLTPKTKNNPEMLAATDPENKNGEKVKVIIISKAGTEGLDFKNIRQVHILEPWYNLNRADQTIGRGVRNKSHCLLPFNKRTVEIYLYGSEIRDSPMEAIDMYMYRIAEDKAIKIGQVTRLLKENAVDCLLNKNQQDMNASNIQKRTTLLLSNNQSIEFDIGHKDNSLICDFMECQYTCKPNNEYSEEVGIETYNENYIIMNIEKILNKIKLLFKEHYMYEKQELIKRLTSMKHYSLEQINMALDILINDDNEFITDMLGRTGKLVNIDKYYMFQPIEISPEQRLSLYKRRHPITFKQKGIVFNKIESKELFTNTEVKEKDDMEIKNLNKYFEILISDNYKKSKKSWVISAKNAINNLHTYNGIAKEILVEFALEHIFDTYSARDKLELLNEFEVIKRNKDKHKGYSDAFIEMFQKTIDKFCIEVDGIKVFSVVDYSKKLIKHQLGVGFFKLDKTSSTNRWLVYDSGVNKKFVEILLSRFKHSLDRYNNFIGFLTKSRSRIVFKVKTLSASANKRVRFGQQLPTTSENKKVTVKRINSILSILNAAPKYGMNDEERKIETIYNDSDIDNVNDMELAVELELVLRFLDSNNHDNKKWFFNTLEDKLNNVEKIKL